MAPKVLHKSAYTMQRLRARASSKARAVRERFVDQTHFVGALAQSPRQTGAVAPTLPELAARMANVIDLTSGLPVLELGPGTGAISRSILAQGVKPENLVVVEYKKQFCQALIKRFPGVSVIQGDAFELDATLAGHGQHRFDCVISGLPLLNFPDAMRLKMLHAALARVPHGRPLVQFSYGVKPPIVVNDPRICVERSPWVWRNLPPARVWTYSLA